MAIATLALCYENKSVFKQVVKIRKGEAIQLIMESTSMDNLKRIMTYYSKMVCFEKMVIVLSCGIIIVTFNVTRNNARSYSICIIK